MAEIALNDVRLHFDKSEVLKDVTFTVPEAKVVALLGPSGSGKTAVMRAITGLTRPTGGSIRIGDRVVFDAAKRIDVPAQKRRAGFLFQSDDFWPEWTVLENVAYCAQLANRGHSDTKVRSVRALEQAGALDLALRRPAQLSAAEQRRVTLARALVCDHPVLLLDDPLSQLDRTARAEARAWLRGLVASLGVSTLIATRDPLEAMSIADHIVLLKAGSVEQQGTPASLYTEPDTQFGAEFMAQSNRLAGTLVENSGTRAFIDVAGYRIGGITQTRAPIGTTATGVIRLDRTMIGGGPGPNRVPMTLTAQMFIGERWEMVFVKDTLTVRAYSSSPLRHNSYHVEFPPDALWVF